MEDARLELAGRRSRGEAEMRMRKKRSGRAGQGKTQGATESKLHAATEA